MTHVAGASSEERRTRLFGTCKFQPVKGEAQVWEAARLDVTRAALDAFAQAASGGAAYPIPTDQMIHGVAVTEAIVRSARLRNEQKHGDDVGRPRSSDGSRQQHGSRQRARPPHVFHARASGGQLGSVVGQPADVRPEGEGAGLAERAVRRLHPAGGADGGTAVATTRRSGRSSRIFSPTTTCTSTRRTPSRTARSRAPS